MTLLQSWADSLTLLKPKNLQLFVMVTIKSIIEAYKLYFKYFWWLMLLFYLSLFFMTSIFTSIMLQGGSDFLIHVIVYSKMLGILPALLYGMLLLAACFVTRPSILQKDCQYLRTQYRKIFLYWLLLVPLYMSYSPWYLFFILFFADSEGGFKSFLFSMWNALKMVVYNLPLVLIIGFCFGMPAVIFNFVFFINPLMYGVVSTLLLPIGVCTYTNIYIKRLHDQFDLYFKQP